MSLPSQTGGTFYDAGKLAGVPVRFSPFYGFLVFIIYLRANSLWFGTIYLLAVTLAIVLHELGHALAAQSFGFRTRIVVHGMGGYCEGASSRSRREDMAIVAAGPLTNLALAIGFWVLSMAASGAPVSLSAFLYASMSVNLFLFLFNMLPILPLDGGRLLQNQLGFHMGASRADGVAAWVGTGVGVVGAVLGFLYSGDWFIPLFLGYLSYMSFQRTARHPFDSTFRAPTESPAAIGTSGFEVPPLVAAAIGMMIGGLIATWARVESDDFARVFLVPGVVWEGRSLWTLLTAPFAAHPLHAYGWFATLAAVWSLGPRVYRVLGTPMRWGILFFGSVALGNIVATASAPYLAWEARPVFGLGAGAMALLVAWARFATPGPVWRRTPWLTPVRFAGFVFLVDTVMSFAGWAPWAWHAHVAGVVMAFVVPPRILDNVLILPQAGENRVH